MISDFELARRLFPKARQLAQDASLTASRTTQVRGWATADSDDGSVTVVLDTDAAGTDAEITVPTTGGITEGSEVQVTLVDGAPVGCSQVGSIDVAQGLARAAQAVADAINQFFWTDSNGVHVTSVPQADWEDAGGADYHSGPNVLINSLGQLFRDGLNNLLALTGGTTPGVSIYDGAGNADSNIVASFVGNLIELGRNGVNAVIRLCGGAFVIDSEVRSDGQAIPRNWLISRLYSDQDNESAGEYFRSRTYVFAKNHPHDGSIELYAHNGYRDNSVGPDFGRDHQPPEEWVYEHKARIVSRATGDESEAGMAAERIWLEGEVLYVSDVNPNNPTTQAITCRVRTLIEALKMVKTAGDTITATGLRIGGYITGNKTECKFTIHTPFRFYGVSGCTISGTYTVRQGGNYLFGSTATTPFSFTSHYNIDSINADLGTINVTISTGVAQNAATNNDPANIVLNTCTITLT